MSDWRYQAACDGYDVEMFFPENRAGINAAKRVCATCPVTEQCLALAEDTETPNFRFGVFGGTSAYQRDVIFGSRDPKPTVPRTVCNRGHYNDDPTSNCKTCAEIQATRTHCKHGHDWVPENLCIRSGRTVCRSCERDRANARYAKKIGRDVA